MRKSYDDFKKIDQALKTAKMQLNQEVDETPLDSAMTDYYQALAHATNIEENLLRTSLE